ARRPGRAPVRARLALLPTLRFLVEARAGILVLSARTPVAVALLARRPRTALGGPLCVRRVPQPSVREPFQHDVLVRAFQLGDCRQQFLLIARADCRRLAVDENRPVGEARRHLTILRRPACTPVTRVAGIPPVLSGLGVPLQLLDQRGSLEMEEPRRLPLVAAG